MKKIMILLASALVLASCGGNHKAAKCADCKDCVCDKDSCCVVDSCGCKADTLDVKADTLVVE